MNKPNNTTEIVTICSAIAAFLAGTGIIHVDFQHVVETTKQVKEISNGINLASIDSIICGVYKIICIVLGGSIITNYIRYKKAKDASIIIQKIQRKLEGSDSEEIKVIVDNNVSQVSQKDIEEIPIVHPEYEDQEDVQEDQEEQEYQEEDLNANIVVTNEEVDTTNIEESPEEDDDNPDVVEDVGDDNITYPLKRF